MSTVVELRGRHLLTLNDYSREERRLVGKNVALVFEKDSTRTRRTIKAVMVATLGS